ncbi:MAG: phosphoribosylformylglycinamidine synthase [Omnitrophica bacterium RBG_13_46_9]|nr:MAG: phosphoribosylformylglycinamidine synthase [Omnitrophica bacterium RBG_13_46_9]
MLKAEIYVKLKDTIADPQGLTVKHALDSLGFKGVDGVRIGRLITIALNLKDRKKAKKDISEMCRKLLSNPIIEEYKFSIKER